MCTFHWTITQESQEVLHMYSILANIFLVSCHSVILIYVSKGSFYVKLELRAGFAKTKASQKNISYWVPHLMSAGLHQFDIKVMR